jgi:alpha-galactosidase
MHAAEMGVELFVIDAGWYAGADTHNTDDFEPGLGTWEADPERFPNGLKALTDYAHSLGMKFGIWVEPERVNLSVVGQDGLNESSLAMANHSYQSPHTALICLGDAAGRKWVMDRLTALIDAVQPDYLKWDNNLWVNCERDGHGHGGSDGNFAHVTALYQMLDTLRRKYPSLTIENCSSGGNRMDLGMLRYTDAAWMDDRTAPSVHVRHNLDGLSVIFPPAYLLSFLTDVGWEPLHGSPDLPLYVRSRMPGVLGLCFQSESLTDEDLEAIGEQVALYKTLRPTLATATAALLSAQANVGAGPAWDVLQETASDGPILLYAFDSDNGPNNTVVSPRDLDPDVVYRVISVDTGMLGDRTGAELMDQGIRIVRSAGTAAHVVSLTPQP